MQDAAQYRLEDLAEGGVAGAGADGTRLVLSGQLTLAAIAPLERGLARLSGTIAAVDLAEVDEIDTIGAWVVCRIAREHGIPCP